MRVNLDLSDIEKPTADKALVTSVNKNSSFLLVNKMKFITRSGIPFPEIIDFYDEPINNYQKSKIQTKSKRK